MPDADHGSAGPAVTGSFGPGDDGSTRVATDPGAPGRSAAPWRPGIATGVGSMPGTDPVEATALVAGELPDLPHVVELPQRGAGADMIGRAVAMLVDMPAEVVPTGWRLARRPGRDLRRAIDFLAWDADAAERHLAGAPWIKVQVAGPWTLAAQMETPTGNRALLDPGAVGDLSASLAEGLAGHLAELSRRLPGTGIVVQVDEPSLPAVLRGTLPTASGFGTVPAVDPARAGELLGMLVNALGDRPSVAHCCHPDAPVRLLRASGFGALSLDLTGIGGAAERLDPIGEAMEAGAVLLAGLVPAREPGAAVGTVGTAGAVGTVGTAGAGTAGHDGAREVPVGDADRGSARRFDFHTATATLLDLWHRIGLPDRRLEQVLVTPTCGLAAASPGWARRALAISRDAARALAERAAQG